MTALLNVETIALLAALQGTMCLAIWPLFADRRTMLLCQFGVAAGFTVHYCLIGVPTAAVLNAMGGIQVLASLAWGDKKGFRWIAWSMVPAIGLVCAVTWSGLPSALSTTGMMLIAVGRTQVDPARLRLLVLAGVPFWLAHDLMVGSPLVIADAISGAVGLWAVAKYWRKPSDPDFPVAPPTPSNVVRLALPDKRVSEGAGHMG